MLISIRNAALLSMIFLTPAVAQTPQASPLTAPAGPGLAGPDNATPPSPGANSFMESQAKKLIEAKGYTNVSALMNDSQGIWHGTATKGDTRFEVSVDYKGHVNAK